jgi:hypothetical protein
MRKREGDENIASGNEIDFVIFILTAIDMHMTIYPITVLYMIFSLSSFLSRGGCCTLFSCLS